VDPVIDAQLREAVKALREARPRDAIAVLDPLSAEVAGSVTDELVVRQLLASAQVAAGDLDAARRHGERALELARLTGDDEAITYAHTFLRRLSADGAWFGDDAEEDTRDAIERAFDEAAQALTRGDGEAAAKALEPVLIAAASSGDFMAEASASGMTAQAMMMLGRLDEARMQAERALEIAEISGDENARAHFAELLEHVDSQTNADAAMAAARVAARTRAALGVAGQAIELGDPGAALQVLWPVLHDACETGATGAEASLRGLIAQALLAENKRPEAIDQANKAAALADALGDAEAGEAFRQIAELALGFIPPTGEA
jgi:tetratricopeptide (TPR) repeat protein